MRLIFIFLIIISGLLQHFVHECGHMLAAKILGEKIVKVQWFTYHGGTRVFYENEPDDYNKNAAKKWAIIASGGYAATNVLGYSLIFLYYMIPNYYLKLVCYIASMMFLITDCLYFTLGSIGNFGDIIGIRDILNIPKSISVLLSIIVFSINILIIKAVFYS